MKHSGREVLVHLTGNKILMYYFLQDKFQEPYKNY